MPVTLGAERFLRDPGSFLEVTGIRRGAGVGGRYGLLTSDGARVGTRDPLPTRVALLKAGLPIVHLFTPEHGLSASAPDGVEIPSGTDPESGLPVTSLYGSELRPEPEALEGLDLLLVELQDVGARFYTYIWTLTHLMEACGELGIPMLLLDRPNPLGGRAEWVEGPLPDEDSPRTFLGRWPIPIRHSLTLGELALLLRAEMGLPLELAVVPMEGWSRDMFWQDTGLPFHPPSPGIPSPESALLYPGLALLEATNIHEGRGTSRAFRWFGAPWMNGEETAGELNRTEPTGVRARSHPLTLPGGGGTFTGVSLEITNAHELRPVALGLRLLSVLLTLWPTRFSWTPYPTAVNPSGGEHLLRLLAKRGVVETLHRAPETIDNAKVDEWTQAHGWWARAVPHLLYK